jgi:hypothetical protein
VNPYTHLDALQLEEPQLAFSGREHLGELHARGRALLFAPPAAARRHHGIEFLPRARESKEAESRLQRLMCFLFAM